MDPLLGSALIGAGSSLLGGIFGANQDFKKQKKLMQYQNELNIQNWNMQNEYNSPSAVMQRYKDAGLNPNLMYGGTSVAAGNVGSVSTPNIDKYQRAAEQAVANASQALQLKLLNAQIQGQQAVTEKTKAEAANTKLDGLLKDFDLKYKQDTRDTSIDILMGNAKSIQADLVTKDLLQQQARKDLTKTEYDIYNTWLSGEETKKRIANLEKDLDVKDFGIKLTRAQIIQIGYVCQNLASQKALYDAKEYNQSVNNRLFDDCYNYYVKQAKYAAIHGNLQNWIDAQRHHNLATTGSFEPTRNLRNWTVGSGPFKFQWQTNPYSNFNIGNPENYNRK